MALQSIGILTRADDLSPRSVAVDGAQQAAETHFIVSPFFAFFSPVRRQLDRYMHFPRNAHRSLVLSPPFPFLLSLFRVSCDDRRISHRFMHVRFDFISCCHILPESRAFDIAYYKY